MGELGQACPPTLHRMGGITASHASTVRLSSSYSFSGWDLVVPESSGPSSFPHSARFLSPAPSLAPAATHLHPALTANSNGEYRRNREEYNLVREVNNNNNNSV